MESSSSKFFPVPDGFVPFNPERETMDDFELNRVFPILVFSSSDTKEEDIKTEK